MKLKFGIILLVSGLFFSSCKKEKKFNLQEYMVGDWQTKYINLEMPTYQKSDSVYVLENDFSKPDATLTQATYKNDSTFTAWYLSPEKEKLDITHGKWVTKKDSLYIEFIMNNEKTSAAYLIKKTEDGFEGKSLNDWDNDGEKDDFLLMKTKRLNVIK